MRALFFLIISGFVCGSTQQNSEYMHQNFLGHFSKNNTFDMAMFINDYKGFYIHLYDLVGNRIRIRFGEKDLVWKINNVSSIVNTTDVCGISSGQPGWLRLLLKTGPKKISISCNNNPTIDISWTLKIRKKFQINKNERKNFNAEQIFMRTGRINYTMSSVYGCMNRFYFNNISSIVNTNGRYLLPSCSGLFNKTSCVMDNCTFYQSLIGNYQCNNSHVIEPNSNMKSISGSGHSYIRTEDINDLMLIIQYTRRPRSFTNQCLIHLKMENQNSITFYSNPMHEIIRIHKNETFTSNKTVLSRTDLLNLNETILITLNGSNIMIQVCGDSGVSVFDEKFDQAPWKMKVGYHLKLSLCKPYEGEIETKWNYIIMHATFRVNHLFQNFIIVCGVFFILSLLITLGVFIWLKIHNSGHKESPAEALPLTSRIGNITIT